MGQNTDAPGFMYGGDCIGQIHVCRNGRLNPQRQNVTCETGDFHPGHNLEGVSVPMRISP